jgi:hypothetical protein
LSSYSRPPQPSEPPERPGILAPYLINAISHQHDMFLAICDRLS